MMILIFQNYGNFGAPKKSLHVFFCWWHRCSQNFSVCRLNWSCRLESHAILLLVLCLLKLDFLLLCERRFYLLSTPSKRSALLFIGTFWTCIHHFQCSCFECQFSTLVQLSVYVRGVYAILNKVVIHWNEIFFHTHSGNLVEWKTFRKRKTRDSIAMLNDEFWMEHVCLFFKIKWKILYPFIHRGHFNRFNIGYMDVVHVHA